MRRSYPSATSYSKLSRKVERRHRAREFGKEQYGKITAKGKTAFAANSLKYIVSDRNILQILLSKRTTDDHKTKLIATYALGRFNKNKTQAINFLSQVWDEYQKRLAESIRNAENSGKKKFGKHKNNPHNLEDSYLNYLSGVIHLTDITDMQINPILHAQWLLEDQEKK